jgi:amino acid adenylation domain-containing protein
MADHFCRLLETALQHKLRPLYQLDYMAQEEKHLLLHIYNDTMAEFDRSATIPQLFRQQVKKAPGATAIICEETVFTYQELDIVTDQLARYLTDKYNTGRNDLVAVSLPRGEWMIIALLGILKTGAAYLPVDPEYPKDRIDYMIADSRCTAILDEAAIREFHLKANLYSTGELPLNGEPGDLFYVIYTSGSSGRPKGVRIKQQSFINLITWYGKLLELRPDDCFLLMAPVSFDLAQKNIFTPLVNGNTLCVPAALYGEYTLLADTIAYRKVTVINAAPSAVYPLLDPLVNEAYHKLSSLRNVVLGGEPILKSNVDEWMQSAICRARLINSYGPTECTDVVSSYVVEGDQMNSLNTIPIGAPAANCSIYILDEHGYLVPPGITGEICIGGACVGDGYLNRPEETVLKFVPDPFQAGDRMYKTGDLGKWSAEGNVEFLGRKDEQVKIRGYRIELGEIENCLKNYPGITLATVIAFTNNYHEQELLAYYTGNIIHDLNDLHSYLLKTLAAYMVPSHFIHLREFPMTPSGKVNRKVLREMGGSMEAAEAPVLPPRNEIEAQLVATWQEVLGRQRVSINDNFFNLGGHSLKLARLGIEIARRMGAKLSFKDLFAHPVLHQQAALVNNAVSAVLPLLPVAGRQLHYPLSSAQKRLWVLSQLEGANVAYNIAGVYELEGNADITAFDKALQTLVARHESLRTVFREDDSGSIRQYILDPGNVNTVIEITDMKDDQQLQSLVQQFCHRPFDLAEGPLLRAAWYVPARHGRLLVLYCITLSAMAGQWASSSMN